MPKMQANLMPALLAAGVALAATAARADDGALRKDLLQARIGLAETKEIYLVLDPAAGEVRLEIQDVVLRRFPATIEVGRPRTTGHEHLVWPALVYTLTEGGSEKPREEIRPPDRDGTAPGDSTPPPPATEDLLHQREKMLASLPANYLLRFSPELAVLVASDETGDDLWDNWSIRWHHALARLKKEPLPTRVTARMKVEDAKRLSVALQQGMSMLVMPPLEPPPPPAKESR